MGGGPLAAAWPQVLVLAAGQGQRFRAAGGHGDKLLAMLEDGEPVLRRTLRLVSAAAPDMLVITDPAATPRITLLEQLGVRWIAPPEVIHGMGASLAAGVAATADAAGWLVVLADMPHLQMATVRQVGDAIAGGAKLAAPVYRGRRGHPVGFGRDWRAALLQLRGDQGARALIQQAEAVWIEVDDPACVADIDLPADLPVPPPEA